MNTENCLDLDKSIEESNDAYADDAQWRFENGYEFITRAEWDAFIEASDIATADEDTLNSIGETIGSCYGFDRSI